MIRKLFIARLGLLCALGLAWLGIIPAFASSLPPKSALVIPISSCPTLPSANLFINGDAEAGAGDPSGNTVPIPGWTTSGALTVMPYGIPEFPAMTSPGPDNRGVNFFAGGLDNAGSSAIQQLDLTCLSTTIDNGSVNFTLAGYLGGYLSQNDNATVTITFLDSSNNVLGNAQIGPVLAVDRSNVTGLWLRTTTGALPSGARKAQVTVNMVRTEGSYNDGYADNLTFSMQVASQSILYLPIVIH